MRSERDEDGFLREALGELRAREDPPPPFAEVLERGRRARASRRRRLAASSVLLVLGLAGSLAFLRGAKPTSPSASSFTGSQSQEPAYWTSARLLAACLKPTAVPEPLYSVPDVAVGSTPAPPLPCWSNGRRFLHGSE